MEATRIASIRPTEVGFVGHGLRRPECVQCTATGDVFVSHFGGGVTRIRPDGSQQDILGPGDPVVATNGLALTRTGDFLCANLLPPGGVWRIDSRGRQSPFLLEVEGYSIPSANFVHIDRCDRVWITVSTRQEPRSLAYRADVADGFIVLVDERGARIVADELGYTNEAKIHPGGDWLYVNETFARRTSRFRIGGDGSLSEREVVARYGQGIFPDGLDFDEAGGLWITSVISNRVLRMAPDGGRHMLLEEYDTNQLGVVEWAYKAGKLGREHLDHIHTEVLKSVSSIAFGGPDRKTVYLGNLLDDRIYTFASSIAGAEPPHWRFET